MKSICLMFLQNLCFIEKKRLNLSKRFGRGGYEGQRAKDKLVKVNRRFVIAIAKQYQHQGLSLIDLIDKGNIGLMKASERFDKCSGFKFMSYAVWWIRQSILNTIAEQGHVERIPLALVEKLRHPK